jgi:hypothetical protein
LYRRLLLDHEEPRMSIGLLRGWMPLCLSVRVIGGHTACSVLTWRFWIWDDLGMRLRPLVGGLTDRRRAATVLVVGGE